jgi:hypothetical protein
VDEEQQMTAARIQLELLVHNPEQAIQTFSQIDGNRAQNQSFGRRTTQYDSTSASNFFR